MGASVYRPFMCGHTCFLPSYEATVAREDGGRYAATMAATLNATARAEAVTEAASKWLREDAQSDLPRFRERERWMPVQVVDIPGWLVKSFTTEDYVVLKADIEGAEH